MLLLFSSYQNALTKHTKTFFDRLPRLKLKNFDNLNKNVTKNVSNKEQVLRSDNRFFGQMLLVASSRKMNMKDVLQHPLGPLPWSLANCDGSMKKTNKAVLAIKLESMAAPAEMIPQSSACIIDVMSLIQKINGENLTFVEVSDHLLTTVLKLCGDCDRVDVVFDIYKQLSIKDAEGHSEHLSQVLVFVLPTLFLGTKSNNGDVFSHVGKVRSNSSAL